jgi:hypothetical protein
MQECKCRMRPFGTSKRVPSPQANQRIRLNQFPTNGGSLFISMVVSLYPGSFPFQSTLDHISLTSKHKTGAKRDFEQRFAYLVLDDPV